MALKNHYLLEDYEMMTDHLENLHRTFTKVLDCATNAEFSSKESILQSINESMTILMALNAKKQQRDSYEVTESEIRRGWFG